MAPDQPVECHLRSGSCYIREIPKTMTPERFRRIADLYDAVLRQPPPERPRFLAEHCSGDDGLRAEVESLLAANAQASGFLSTPAKEVADIGRASCRVRV